MQVYEVIQTNLDVKDGEFINLLYISMDRAIQALKDEIESKQGTDIEEDFAGTAVEYKERSLHWTNCKGCPAIYYTSHYGDYRCVVFVKTRTIIE